MMSCSGGAIVIVLTSSVVVCVFEPPSGQIKRYKIGICVTADVHFTDTYLGVC